MFTSQKYAREARRLLAACRRVAVANSRADGLPRARSQPSIMRATFCGYSESLIPRGIIDSTGTFHPHRLFLNTILSFRSRDDDEIIGENLDSIVAIEKLVVCKSKQQFRTLSSTQE